jgi:endonuclease III
MLCNGMSSGFSRSPGGRANVKKLERLLTLGEAVRILREFHGPPENLPTSDPFELILWENVAYLATPTRRREAFEDLKRTVGTAPAAILGAKQQVLERVAARGILKTTFAAKLRQCAKIALDSFRGDLGAVIREPLNIATRALRRFPGIGEPGAEKILLFTGQQPLLAADSNGLRVLVRLGLVREDKSYARTYRASREIAKGLAVEPIVMQEAHLLIQQHGRTLCKRSAPRCQECPLVAKCDYAGKVGALGKLSSPPKVSRKKTAKRTPTKRNPTARD